MFIDPAASGCKATDGETLVAATASWAGATRGQTDRACFLGVGSLKPAAQRGASSKPAEGAQPRQPAHLLPQMALGVQRKEDRTGLGVGADCPIRQTGPGVCLRLPGAGSHQGPFRRPDRPAAGLPGSREHRVVVLSAGAWLHGRPHAQSPQGQPQPSSPQSHQADEKTKVWRGQVTSAEWGCLKAGVLGPLRPEEGADGAEI